MIMRQCPRCGSRFYSADTSSRNWPCENCGSYIPKTCEQPANDNIDHYHSSIDDPTPWELWINQSKHGEFATVLSARAAAERLFPGMTWTEDYLGVDDNGNKAELIHKHGAQADKITD